MRVAIVGVTGNVGTSALRSLEGESRVESVLGLARRTPRLSVPKVEWASADVVEDDLVSHFRGADAVVLLSWLIQPSRDLEKLWSVNVDGSLRAARAAAEAGVPALVYASSVGAYSPGPKGSRVDESWPTGGIRSSYYSRQKAEVERRLNLVEAEHPEMRLVRLRPGLVFKRDASQGIRRLFGGPLFPGSLIRPALSAFVPELRGLRSQVVHSYDVGEAVRLALLSDARGAFNLATEPPLDARRVAEHFGGRTVRVPGGLARAAVDVSWRLRLHPVAPGWLDLARRVPLMDTTRARQELGWSPGYDAGQTLEDVISGLESGAGLGTPVLSPHSGSLRAREFETGVGGSEP